MTENRKLGGDESLSERRNFLLKSLHGLDQELADGNLDPEDHELLVARYTRQLAALAQRENTNDTHRDSKRSYRTKTLLWVFGIVIVGGVAGLVVNQTAGDRMEGESITGSLRQSVNSQMLQAQNLLNDPERWGEAIAIFTDVVQKQPSNVEALTYRAWLQYQQGGDIEAQINAWEEALLIEPGFGDALVFLSIALANQRQFDQASLYLDELRSTDTRSDITEIILQRGLYGEVYGESRYSLIVNLAEPSLEDLGLEPDIGLEAANYLLLSDKDDRTVSAIKIYRAIISDFPTHPEALSREALLLWQTGEQALLTRALDQLNLAVLENPNNFEALLSRATVRAGFDQIGACNDLESINEIFAVSDLTPEIQFSIEKVSDTAECTS